MVTCPNSVVGELCPFVRPYTPLSIITQVTSRLRCACGPMCSPPMLRKSPSPATITVFNSGLPIFTPKARGSVRPCMPWRPKGCSPSVRCTIFPEQPIPATITLLEYGTSYFVVRDSKAHSRARRTPKSPQPGHHLKSYSAFRPLIPPLSGPILYEPSQRSGLPGPTGGMGSRCTV